MTEPFSIELKVRDYECDLQGVVNNAVYQNYLEHARHEFLLESGIDFAALAAEGINLVVIRAELDYKLPLRSGDAFRIDTTVEQLSPVRLAFHQQILRLPDEKTAVIGRILGTALNERGRPQLPDGFADRAGRHARMSEAGAKRYTLWRQDDNGQQFRIAAFSRRASAEERMRELQGGGHKQMYWIEATAPPDLRLGNLYRNIPDNLPQELIEPLLHSDQLRVERIVSRQHASAEGAWYDQPEDEWVLLVAGRARLEFADPAASLDLKAGDYLLIPAHCRHRVAMTDSQRDSIWLALHLKLGTAR